MALFALAFAPRQAVADDAAAPPTVEVAGEQTENQGPSAEKSNPAPVIATELLAEWVRQLDDDRYAVRESAQKHLSAAGAGALQAIGEVAAAGSLESSTRAVSILLSWSTAKDAPLRLAALEQLAALKNRPTEAAAAYQRLAEVRQGAAIEAIKKMGGRVDYDRSFGMLGGSNPPLQVIIGPQWKGGVEGLKQIAAVQTATTLSLHSAPLDDGALAELGSLRQIQRIEVFGTGLSADAVAKLQQQLPHTKVDVRGGARLGIAGLDIQRIVADSPAAKAGLQRADRITEFAGEPIETFDELTQQIAKCQPGESVAIKVLRGGQTLEKNVTFDRWGDDERTSLGAAPGEDPFGDPVLVPMPVPQRIIIDNRR